MEFCWDFIQCLGADLSMSIFMCLDDPSDLARVCAVSNSWRHLVIENGLSKHLCLKLFPEISSVTRTIEEKNVIDPIKISPENSSKWEMMQRDHKVYATLSRGLSFMRKDCISEAISASSTDNYPEEGIQNTLELSDKVGGRASYWSSKGASDPSVPEILFYQLISKVCVVTEINLQPFQAYFQLGFPIYSPKAVRFKMGHFRLGDGIVTFSDGARLEYFKWTYTSPVFPMAQENHLQKFKLPEPVLCIGGYLAVELLGRVQRQDIDGLYYTCVSHVQVVGRSLSPAFRVEIYNNACRLKYRQSAEQEQCQCCSACRLADEGQSEATSSSSGGLSRFGASKRMWEEMFLNQWLRNGGVVGDGHSDLDEDKDE